MKELIAHIAQELVDHPDEVEVTSDESGEAAEYHLRVDPDDLGKVIGRRGRTASALRSIISASALKNNTKASLEILEPDEE